MMSYSYPLPPLLNFFLIGSARISGPGLVPVGGGAVAPICPPVATLMITATQSIATNSGADSIGHRELQTTKEIRGKEVD